MMGGMAAKRPLSPKQQLFVAEYLIDLNATAAYKRAGYKYSSETAATAHAARLVANGRVAAAVALAQTARSERLSLTADRVLQEVSLIAFSDLGDVLDFSGDKLHLRKPSEIPESARRAISSIKVKRIWEGAGDDAVEVEIIEFKLWSKDAALAKAMNHLGLLKERLEITHVTDVELLAAASAAADKLAGVHSQATAAVPPGSAAADTPAGPACRPLPLPE